ncbi:GATOR complex protein NPRL3-like [Anneissia japonica]|uniref:GATOR complex protein NPRL3-like n=1 Tax=Anneissia japonica TaxID=1529436 RepID=UPI0014256D99|nr:GATOR complex protein NPRL3-like [Anneissia japonica]
MPNSTSTPIGLILVSSGSRGEKLLFRYPYQETSSQEHTEKAKHSSPYALPTEDDDLDYFSGRSQNDYTVLGKLYGFSDKILPVILCNTSLCGKKFELTVDDVKFVGHPTGINERDLKNSRKYQKSSKREETTMTMFSLVFVLHENADVSVVHCYHDLCKRLALALKHEEKRCGYLSHQAKIMLAVHDEVTAMPEDSETSPYELMLTKSKLCEDLQSIYLGLCDTGVTRVHINNWIEVSFCLPHKVHKVDQMRAIKSDVVEKYLAAIRPYHAMLLLEEESSLIMSLPPDCSPSLVRIIKLATPIKSLQQLSQDSDIALSQVFQLVGHLVYWGKATVIFPLCETNIYILSPQTPTLLSNLQLLEDFNSKFPQFSQFPLTENAARHAALISVLSEFSLPTPLSDHTTILDHDLQKGDLVKLVVWLLKRRLLVQRHTYTFIVPMDQDEEEDKKPGRYLGKPLGSHHKLEIELKQSAAEAVSVDSDDINTATSTSLDTFSTRSMEDAQALYRSRSLEILKEYLSEEEIASVCKVPAANVAEDLKLFARLCPYFRGHHHLEEIMYLENMNRSQLHTILDKFSQVLFTCVHEDAATVTYKEFL